MHSWRLIKCSVSFSIAIIIILSLEEEVSHIFNEHITYIYKNVCKSNMQLHVFTSYVLWWKKLKLILLLTKNRLVNIALQRFLSISTILQHIIYLCVIFRYNLLHFSRHNLSRCPFSLLKRQFRDDWNRFFLPAQYSILSVAINW